MSHQCELCRARGKTWNGDDPKCAFDERGNFTTDNWCCATMVELREACKDPKKGTAVWSSDHWVGTLPTDEILDDYLPDGRSPVTHVVLNWYKGRGRTPAAFTFDAEYQAIVISERFAVALAKMVRR